MKELSKQEKINLLHEVVKYLISRKSCYMCIIIETIMYKIEDREYKSCKGAIEKYVPELLRYKPKYLYDDTDAWFGPDSIRKRIEIVIKTIEDIEASMS